MMALIAATSLHPSDYFAINSTQQAFASLGLQVQDLPMLSHMVGEDLMHRPGGAVSLAVGMADVFSKIPYMEQFMGFWYHFCIMFEALFILTLIDAGSRVGRYLLQELLDDNGSGMELSGMDSISINEAGISLAFVPEDRIGMGLVGDMDMTDNMMLRSYRNGKGPFLDRKGPRALAQKIKDQLEVMTPSISAPVRQMSGGNVQKVLVGREIAQNPKVLLVAFPTRGVDINTSHVIYQLLNEQKKKGVAVVCVIEDLDVVLELCDRIAVLCGGRISGVVDGRTATKEGIGLLMTKHEKGGAVNE